MPVTVERLSNEPILVATLTGYVTVDDIREIYLQSKPLIGDASGTFYRITDVREANSNFLEMAKAIQLARQSGAASTSDNQIRVTFVGTTTWIEFARNAMVNTGTATAAFEDMETALESVRLLIKQGAQEGDSAGGAPAPSAAADDAPELEPA